jgi:hypothetical protein
VGDGVAHVWNRRQVPAVRAFSGAISVKADDWAAAMIGAKATHTTLRD